MKEMKKYIAYSELRLARTACRKAEIDNLSITLEFLRGLAADRVSSMASGGNEIGFSY